MAPSPSPATPAVSARAENSAHAVVDTAVINVDTHDELEDVLVSLMAEFDVADGGSAEAWHDHSEGGSAASEATFGSGVSVSSGDSDASATRAAATDSVVGGKAAKGKPTKTVPKFDKAAYEAAFGDMTYHVAVTTLFVK